MKPINTIIYNHILSNPMFSVKLEKAKCFSKIKLLFELKLGINPRICEAIGYMFKKDDTLLIAISHPAYAMELKYNSNKIIKLLNSNYEDNIIDIKKCLNELNNIKKIQTFIPKMTSNKLSKNNQREYKKSDFYYTERSQAIFVNNIENESLRAKFEDIRNEIKEHKCQ